MLVKAWMKTDKGLRRTSNQDALLLSQDLGLYILADGMGGHTGGEVASQMATQELLKFIQRESLKFTEPRELLFAGIAEANHLIHQKAQEPGANLTGMGTTLVVFFVKNNQALIANVGDSRAYLHRNQNLWQLTEDHSLVQERIKQGLLDPNRAESFVGKNVITRSVGFEKSVQPDILEREMQVGDTYLLCSDGLTGMMTDVEINAVLNTQSGEVAVDHLIQGALDGGGTDNVSVLLLQIIER
jgi:serine/threonine protein phosphatase PrpC